jgi:hypothetical protein
MQLHDAVTVAFSGRLASAKLRFDPRCLSWVVEVGPVTLTSRQFVNLGLRVVEATEIEHRDLAEYGFIGEHAGARAFSAIHPRHRRHRI